MTHLELIDALKKKGQNEAMRIWLEAEAETRKFRAEASARIDQARSESERELRRVKERLENSCLAEAERKIRRIQVVAKNELSVRLFQLGQESLCDFRNQDYEGLFAALADELPSGEWHQVRVHPADEGLARKHFPKAQVSCDATICGGMEVAGEDGLIRINNTLEKRLERAWPDILPGLIDNLFHQAFNHEASA